MKIAILSTVNSIFREYEEDSINISMPFHITDWETIDDSTFWEIQEGLRILNDSPESKKSGVSYRIFVNNENTKDMVVKSVAAYRQMVKERAKQEEERKEKYRQSLEASKLSRVLKQRQKTLKSAIGTLELTGGDKVVLEGLRKELDSLQPKKKKEKT